MFSLIIPIFNEEKLIDELLKRCVASIELFTDDYEIIIVDDGSTDLSLRNILIWQEQNSKIKILSLSKNFGHQAAFTAGLENAKGEIVGMMDGDLQDPPELLPEMYHKLIEEEFDIVNEKRSSRNGKKG
jgi:dolichol-phosphate mannosyltransferase